MDKTLVVIIDSISLDTMLGVSEDSRKKHAFLYYTHQNVIAQHKNTSRASFFGGRGGEEGFRM